jgi:alkanesulfonate monooxygenase SsuD/methylene tetrahydromethanopterin reductase-like flavin-dependent oxidoreductase (luciferase family)
VTLGVVFRPQFAPERLRGVARTAEAAGLEQLWLWEDCFGESGISAAAAALAWTDHLRVAIGLLPVPLRNVALTAMEIATLARLFPGRVEVGVGHGVQDWMGQVGARVDSPVTLLREHLTALRALLAGERVTMDGRYVKLDGVKLDWPPERPPPLLAGATGPRTLDLVATHADGTILTGGTSPAGVRAARERLAAARAGRTDPHPVAAYLMAATGPGAAERIAAEVAEWKLDPTADVAVAGDASDVAAAVRRWTGAGADTVVLQPTPDEPDLEAFIHFAVEQVRPLV